MGKYSVVRLDEIGIWSEIKLEIIRKYASVYSRILTEKGFYHVYVDAFAGAGMHFSETTREWVKGSPQLVLDTDPPFRIHHFIELDPDKAKELDYLVGTRDDVKIYREDCNQCLIQKIFPTIHYNQYMRCLCLLDPYGLQLDWKVLTTAGQSNTTEVFLNFPTMDINRNVLRRDKSKVTPSSMSRMDRFWGDRTWESVGYDSQATLFGDVEEKVTNERFVQAYVERLKKVAGFAHVASPLPMRYKGGPVLYYLIHASQIPVANDIVQSIFSYYTKRGLN